MSVVLAILKTKNNPFHLLNPKVKDIEIYVNNEKKKVSEDFIEYVKNLNEVPIDIRSKDKIPPSWPAASKAAFSDNIIVQAFIIPDKDVKKFLNYNSELDPLVIDPCAAFIKKDSEIIAISEFDRPRSFVRKTKIFPRQDSNFEYSNINNIQIAITNNEKAFYKILRNRKKLSK